ncbi:MAG TPA: thioredoxin family protein [Luteolibacter sp.]|nr:thioredoxin family protein [Luteolibacter sp.]
MKITSLVCAVVMALNGTTLAGGEGWTSDFEAAKKQATEEKKDLLMDFTGSDWCGWCIKLKDEVFKHDEFNSGVKDTFVLVEIDFPKDKSKLSEETQKQNRELGEKYGIEGYPTILLTDAAGRPYAATGYQAGGPEKYVAHLNELRGRKAARDEAFAAAEKLEGPEKAKALIDALEKLELSESAVSNHYPDVVEQIKAADPEDTTGYAKNLANRQRIADFQNELQTLAEKEDMAGAMALVDKTLADGGFETEETLQLMMTRAIIFAEQGKFDEALKAVDDAKAFAPESPLIPGIDQFRERLEESRDKKDEGEKQEG